MTVCGPQWQSADDNAILKSAANPATMTTMRSQIAQKDRERGGEEGPVVRLGSSSIVKTAARVGWLYFLSEVWEAFKPTLNAITAHCAQQCHPVHSGARSIAMAGEDFEEGNPNKENSFEVCSLCTTVQLCNIACEWIDWQTGSCHLAVILL